MSSPAPSSHSNPDTLPAPDDINWARFAILSPDNADAETDLQGVVDWLGGEAHLRQSFQGAFIESTQVTVVGRCREGDSSDDDEHYEVDEHKRFRFVLSFNLKPQGPRAGWVLSKGNHHCPGAELQLCRPRVNRVSMRPSCAFGLIYMHPVSGAFLLQALSATHPIVYRSGNGNSDIILQLGDKTVLHMTRNHLRFCLGSRTLDYVLEFRVEDEDRFVIARNRFAKEAIRKDDVEPYWQLDSLPKQSHHRIRSVVIHRTISAGTFGLVKSGVDTRTGDAVAIKTIHCRARQVPTIKNEIDIASSFALDTIGIVPMMDTWCEHGDSPPCFSSPLEDIHFSMPLARYDFEHAPWHVIDDKIRMILFRQTLQGLQTIHSSQIIHRDISPRNLLIYSQEPPKAGICDFGKAKRGSQGMETGIGPIHTVAPEVWTGPYPYSSAVDVWSLAYAWLDSFQKRTDYKSKTDVRRQALLIATIDDLCLQGRISPDFAQLLRWMLAIDPCKRPTAAKALQHVAWDKILADGTECNIPEFGTPSPGLRPAKRLRSEFWPMNAVGAYDGSIPSTLTPPS